MWKTSLKLSVLLVVVVANSANYGCTFSDSQEIVKWGVYREAGIDGNVITSDNVLTRIAYHDNIRIIKMN